MQRSMQRVFLQVTQMLQRQLQLLLQMLIAAQMQHLSKELLICSVQGRQAGAASSGPSGGNPASAASTATAAERAQMQRHQDTLPDRLLDRERRRISQQSRREGRAHHHSVFVRYDDEQHIETVVEQTRCERQVGFEAGSRQRRDWLNPVRAAIGAGAAILAAAWMKRGL